MSNNRIVVTLLGMLVASQFVSPSVEAADQVRWRPSLDQAKIEAAQSGKLLLIHFWTPSCGPCRVLDQEVFSQPQVGETVERYFVPVKVNADVSPALASSFRLDRVPAEVILTPHSSLLATLSCPLNADAYLTQLTNFAEHYISQTNRYANSAQTPQQSAYLGSDSSQFASSNPANASAQPAMATSNTYGVPPVPGMTMNPYGSTNSHEQSPTHTQPGPPSVFAQGPGAQGPDSQSFPPQGTVAQGPAAITNNHSPQVPGNAMPNSYRPQSMETGSSPTHPAALSPGDQPMVQTAAAQVSNNPAGQPHGMTTHNLFATQQQQQQQAESEPEPIELPQGSPPLAFDGHCPVSLRTTNKWVEGVPSCGVIHRGRTFLLAGEPQRQQFMADPDSYSPVFSGMDPVLLLDDGQQVEGSRKYGFEYRGAFYLFSNQQSMNKFHAQPDKYAAGVRQAMNRLDGPGNDVLRR